MKQDPYATTSEKLGEDLREPEKPGASLSTFMCCVLASNLVAEVLGVNALLVRASPRGSRRLAVARQLAVHLVHVVAGRNHQEVAGAFGRNRSTATHHFETVEDLRDVQAFDDFVELLETRYAMQLRYAAMASAVQAWKQALAAVGEAVEDGALEGEAIDAGEYLVETFREVG